jgi:hypothetical protein
MRLALVVSIAGLASACGSSDPCASLSGTCVTLTVNSAHVSRVDAVDVMATGAISGSHSATANGAQSLPVKIALRFPATVTGKIHLDVAGRLGATVVGTGSTDGNIVAGMHSPLAVDIEPNGTIVDMAMTGSDGGDLGVGPDLSSDGGTAPPDLSAADMAPHVFTVWVAGYDQTTSVPAIYSWQTGVSTDWMGYSIPTNVAQLNGIWAAAPDDVWTVGGHVNSAGSAAQNDVTFYHYAPGGGGLWALCQSSNANCTSTGTPNPGMYSVFGFASNDIWAGGVAQVVHWSGGTAWTLNSPTFPQGCTADACKIVGIWGTSSTDLWAMLPGGAYHLAGTTWSSIVLFPGPSTGFWGSATNDVWAVGANGTPQAFVTHYDGSTWTPNTLPTSTGLNAIFGFAKGDIYAVGKAGTMFHFSGGVWNSFSSGTTNDLYSIWGTSDTDLWIGGDRVLQHWDGHTWTPHIPSGASSNMLYASLSGG